MEKFTMKLINKNQNGLKKFKNKQFTSLTSARAYLPGRAQPVAVDELPS